jgi:hypothetical protein
MKDRSSRRNRQDLFGIGNVEKLLQSQIRQSNSEGAKILEIFREMESKI